MTIHNKLFFCIVLVLGPVLLGGCLAANRPYTPIHTGPVSRGYQLAPPGTVQADFYWAMQARTLGQAERRWKEYLNKHGPIDGGFEDAPHYTHFLKAQQELKRIYFLLGQFEDSDDSLKDFDPVEPK